MFPAEVFTPWFTGQVIQGIAIEKSKAKFTHAIIVMALLAAGRSVSGMEASTGLLANDWKMLCWAGWNFDLASKMSYYFNTDYGIWELSGR